MKNQLTWKDSDECFWQFHSH